jgi:hypothetical protein
MWNLMFDSRVPAYYLCYFRSLNSTKILSFSCCKKGNKAPNWQKVVEYVMRILLRCVKWQIKSGFLTTGARSWAGSRVHTRATRMHLVGAAVYDAQRVHKSGPVLYSRRATEFQQRHKSPARPARWLTCFTSRRITSHTSLTRSLAVQSWCALIKREAHYTILWLCTRFRYTCRRVAQEN